MSELDALLEWARSFPEHEHEWEHEQKQQKRWGPFTMEDLAIVRSCWCGVREVTGHMAVA